MTEQQSVPEILPAELRERLAKDTDIVLLDVREPFEHAERHIEGCVLIPLGQLENRLDELQSYRDRPVVVYCRSGARSARACAFLNAQGFQTRNLAGGILEW